MATVSGATIARRAVGAVLGASLLGLFVLPIVALLWYAGAGGIVRATSDIGFRTSLEFTLLASGMAVGLGLLTGIPLGYALARYRFPGRSIVESLVLLPVVIPHLIVGIALLLLLEPGAPLGRVMTALGIPTFDAIAGVVLVMLYVGGAYVVLASEIAFRSVDVGLLESARALGATPSEAFATVTLPLAARGIGTGALLMWARGVSEVGAFLIFAYGVSPGGLWPGPQTTAASVYVWMLYNDVGLAGSAAAASVLVLIALAIFLGIRLFDRSGLSGLPGPWLP